MWTDGFGSQTVWSKATSYMMIGRVPMSDIVIAIKGFNASISQSGSQFSILKY